MIHTLLQLLVSFGLAILSRKNGVNEKWSTKEYEAEKQKEISKLNKSWMQMGIAAMADSDVDDEQWMITKGERYDVQKRPGAYG